MKRRVAIVGTGWVGSSVAISTLHSGVADELLLHDLREDLAEGDAAVGQVVNAGSGRRRRRWAALVINVPSSAALADT